MVLGLSTATFTLLHVIISLIGIASGLVVAGGLWRGKRLGYWTGLFLTTTILTSVTGFMFHSTSFGPPHIVGVISLVVLALALLALYRHRLAGAWRRVYVTTALLALYLNCFVGVVQAFGKIPALEKLAPTQSEAPFSVAQLALLTLFVVLGIVSVRRFRSAPREHPGAGDAPAST
ncbi:MAG TPA: hypothetical protein VHB68_04185 [Steroidobacteraceae bacterium]|nr:hypothetical protein [Steroidobacteraceae bacterium]